MGLDEGIGRERIGDGTEGRAREHCSGDRERRGTKADTLQHAAAIHDQLVPLLRVDRGGPFSLRVVVVHAALLCLVQNPPR